MGTLRFEGQLIQVPDDATTEEIFQLINFASGFDADKRLLEKLEEHEGMRQWMYKDTEGHPTVGIGFNLDRSGASATLKRVLELTDEQIADVRAGTLPVTREQAQLLLREDVKTARLDAASLFKTFATQPKLIQETLINMSFNIGKSKLSKFQNFRDAIDNRDYNKATFEMLNNKKADGTVTVTPWATQVKGRALELAALVHSFGKPATAGGKEIADFLQADAAAPLAPLVPQLAPQLAEVTPTSTQPETPPTVSASTPLSTSQILEEQRFISTLPESKGEEEARQEAIRRRTGIGEFAGETRRRRKEDQVADAETPL